MSQKSLVGQLFRAASAFCLLALVLGQGRAAAPPGLTLNIRDFGAVGDGQTKDTRAIQQALDRCRVLGGGEVVVPAGSYLTGAIALRTGTTLHLDAGAILLGSSDLADYPVAQVRWEGKWIPGHVGLIYALDTDHIGIVGPGKIVGNAAVSGRPTAADPLRRPALIEPIGGQDIHLEGFSTEYHSMWSLHPTLCDTVTIKNLTIRSTGGNGDGIDVDSCRHVVIDGCDIATGDDCISLKSGRGEEGYTLLKTTEDVQISHCTLADSLFACIGIGSETSGGIKHVNIDHCTFTHAQTYAIYIKSRVGRGAFLLDINADDLTVSGTIGGFLRFNLLSSGLQDQNPVPGDDGIPTLMDFRFSHVRVTDCPVLVDGTSIDPQKPLDGFSLAHVTGTCAQGIALANIRHAEIADIPVTGFAGPLLRLANVTGTGLAGAAALTPPPVPAPIPAPVEPYRLH